MDKLFTKINKPKLPFDISYEDKLFFFGSCFSNSIGQEFLNRKFETNINSFGTIFNPYSIFRLLEKILKKENFKDEEWIYLNKKYINLQLHSKNSFDTKEKAILEISKNIDNTNEYLKDTNYLFITLGTSWVYSYKNKLVGNCHKLPQKYFKKKLLSVEEITNQGNKVLEKINPNIKIIFTVSPVRYLSFGAFENSLSKANLLLSIKKLQDNFENIYYLPIYELFMDEMRDYRFYSEDLLHPNSLGVKYVWNYLQDVLFNKETIKDIKNIESIVKSLNHRPINPNSEKHKLFLKELHKKINLIKNNIL